MRKITITFLAALILCGCSNYRKTFDGKAPSNKYKEIGPKRIVRTNTASVYSFRVCEGHGLYKEKQDVNHQSHYVVQEVPLRIYYNYANAGVCEDCILVEETYVMFDSLNVTGVSNGKLVYVATHKTFDRFKFDKESGMQKVDTMAETRSGDIRQYYTDAKKRINLATAFEIMQGRWIMLDSGKLMLNIPNESDAGFYTIYAEKSLKANNEIVFKQITNPTIDKYSSTKSGKEMAVEINSAIRFENDTSGLTFHKINPNRKIIADFADPGLHEKTIQRLETCIQRKEAKRKNCDKPKEKITALNKFEDQFRTVLVDMERKARHAYNAERSEGIRKDSLHRILTYANWFNTHFEKSNFTVDSLEFGKLKKGCKTKHYLKAWCSDYKMDNEGEKLNDNISTVLGDFSTAEKEAKYIVEFFSMKEGKRKVQIREMIKMVTNAKIQNSELYIDHLSELEISHVHRHYFKEHKKLYLLD